MNASDLPGKPYKAALKCPACGWGFDLGLRDIGWEVDAKDQESRAFTCCSKCLNTLSFAHDGSDARLLSEPEYKALPDEVRAMLAKGQFLAALAQHMNRGPVQ